MVASDSRTPFTSLRESFPSFSSASLEMRSDFDIGLPIRSISSRALPAGAGKSLGIVGETRGSWKRKASGRAWSRLSSPIPPLSDRMAEEAAGGLLVVETHRERLVVVGEGAGVQRQKPRRHEQQVERSRAARSADLQRRDAQVPAPPKDVRLAIGVGKQLEGHLGSGGRTGHRRLGPLVGKRQIGRAGGRPGGARRLERVRVRCGARCAAAGEDRESERQRDRRRGEGTGVGHGASPPARLSGEVDAVGILDEAYLTPGLGTYPAIGFCSVPLTLPSRTSTGSGGSSS